MSARSSVCPARKSQIFLFFFPNPQIEEPSVSLSDRLSICPCMPASPDPRPLSAVCPVNLAVNPPALLATWRVVVSLSVCLWIRTIKFGAKTRFWGRGALRRVDSGGAAPLRLCRQHGVSDVVREGTLLVYRNHKFQHLYSVGNDTIRAFIHSLQRSIVLSSWLLGS